MTRKFHTVDAPASIAIYEGTRLVARFPYTRYETPEDARQAAESLVFKLEETAAAMAAEKGKTHAKTKQARKV